MTSPYLPQQKKSRWSNFGAEYTQAFLDKAAKLADDQTAADAPRKFAKQLLELATLHSSFQEHQALPGLCKLLSTTKAPPSELAGSLTLLKDWLFLRKTKRIHQQILNCAKQLTPGYYAIFVGFVKQEVMSVCAEAVEPSLDAATTVTETLLSLLENEQLRGHLRDCVLPMASFLVNNLAAIIATAKSPYHSATEVSQDMVSCLYLLLQHHHAALIDPSLPNGHTAIVQVAMAMLDILQEELLLRDGLKSAAVTLWRAALLPNVSNASAALTLAQTLAPTSISLRLVDQAEGTGSPDRRMGFLAAHLQAHGTSLATRLKGLPLLSRSCTLHGILSLLTEQVLLVSLTALPSPLAGGLPPMALNCQDGTRGEPSLASGSGSAWDLLVDGAIPMACWMVRAASEAHTKHHSLAALTLALQRTASRLQAALLGERLENFRERLQDDCQPGNGRSPIALNSRSQVLLMKYGVRNDVLATLQENWEAPMLQNSRQIHVAFEAFLDILKLQADNITLFGLPPSHAPETLDYIRSAALQLLTSGRRQKGMYTPLKALVSRMGTSWLLELQPGIVTDCFAAMEEDGPCQTVAAFLEELLKQLLSEFKAESPASANHGTACGVWRWREAWVDPLLQAMVSGSHRRRSNLSIYFIPVALNIDASSLPNLLAKALEPLHAQLRAEVDRNVATVVAILKAARLLGLVENVERVQVAGELPVSIPPAVLWRAVRHSSEQMRTDVVQFLCVHPKLTLFPGELELKLVAEALSLALRCSTSNMRNKWVGYLARLIQRAVASLRIALSKKVDSDTERDSTGIARQTSFLRWLSITLRSSIYPGAPFQRKYFASVLLNHLLELWTYDGDWTPGRAARRERQAACSPTAFDTQVSGNPLFPPIFIGPQTVVSLLEASVDTWDRTRDSVMATLARLPALLPGFEGPSQVAALLEWAASLTASPRVFEADSGSRVVRMVFQKYVVRQRARLHWTDNNRLAVTGGFERVGLQQSCLDFLQTLVAKLEEAVVLGDLNLEAACRSGFAHGLLLATRYVLEAFPWLELVLEEGNEDLRARLREVLHHLVDLLMRVGRITLPVLALYQDAYIGAEEVMAGEGDGDYEEEAGCEADIDAPSGQLITSACWLSLKEAVLVVGIMARHIPPFAEGGSAFMDKWKLEEAGNLFLTLLTKMKHNGAVEKCISGFVSLTERLLKEPSMQTVPEDWLDILLKTICRDGQCLSDINRRSAGIPFAFTAIFLGEPQGGHRKLLRKGMSQLMGIAEGKVAGEQPYPQVHAFNAMRLVFLDKALGSDVSAFIAQGVKATMTALSSPHWEVRNAGSLCFSALAVRILGFKNTGQAGSAITSLEFFQRYPTLHTFLMSQLLNAKEKLQAKQTALHPSLFPILALLARLRAPTWQMVGVPIAQSPAAFEAVISSLARTNYLAIRNQAAVALTRLLTPDQLRSTLDQLLERTSTCSSPHDFNEAHGDLLMVKAIFHADAESLSTPTHVQQVTKTVELAMKIGCPTIQADCLEVGKAALRLLGAMKGEQAIQGAGRLANTMRKVCMGVLEELDALEGRPPQGEIEGVAAQRLRREAMRPLLIETAVFGLLESTAEVLPTGSSEGSTQSIADQHPSAESRQHRHMQMLLDSRNPHTRMACLKALSSLLTQGSIQPGPWLDGLMEEFCTRERDGEQIRLAHCIKALAVSSVGTTESDPQTQQHEASKKQDDRANSHSSVPAKAAQSHLQPGTGGKSLPAGLSDETRFERKEKGEEWADMESLYQEARGPEAREGLLRSMGALIRGILERGRDPDGQPDFVRAFLLHVEAASHPAQVMPMRVAAQEAIQISGLLSRDPNDWNLSLEAWVRTLQMTEDEDPEVRSAAAKSLGQAMLGLGLQRENVSYATVEFVQQKCFAALTERCKLNRKYVQHLLQWIYVVETQAASSEASLQKGHLLFHKERDNQHEEPLLMASHALSQLEALLSGPEVDDVIASLVGEWAQAVLSDLHGVLQQSSPGPSHTRELSGPTFLPYVFHKTYCGLLGVNAAAILPQLLQGPQKTAVQQRLSQIASLLKRHSRHILAQEALELAQQSWLTPKGQDESQGEISGLQSLQHLPLLSRY